MASLLVNGVQRDAELSAERSLLVLLREDLGLTGAKPGCGEGECGACTVLLDGEPVRACVTASSAAAGRAVTTIEGPAHGGALTALQEAFVSEGAVQCGYCTPGMVLAAQALLARMPSPGAADIRAALAGNVCRCCAYPRIERAVLRAAGAPGAPAVAGDTPRAGVQTFRPRAPWDLVAPAQREYFELLGDGLVVVLAPGDRPRPPGLPGGGGWLHVAPGGSVTAFTGKVDVGQDNRTALSLIVAEELGVEPGAVGLIMGDTDLCPFDVGTFGSRSLPDAGGDLRVCAATARELVAEIGELAGVRRIAPARPDIALTAPADRRLYGRPAARATARDMVCGAHRFASDLARPGMLHGRILWPLAHGATLTSVRLERARAVPGATVVAEGDLVAVAAREAAVAGRALAAVDAAWAVPEQPAEADLVAHLRSHPVALSGWEGPVHDEGGDVERALAAADVRLEATYTTAFIAHASLETQVALAEWTGGRLTVWTNAQMPFLVRAELAGALGVGQERVRVIVPDTGGGFGSKHTERVAVAAASLARAAGRPVRVALSREEEFRHTHVRPAAVIDVRSGARADGMITAWELTDVNAGAAALGSPYETADQRVAFEPAAAPLPQGPYRALAATANAFARESHVDELAQALGLDPLQLRLDNLRDERLADVLRAAAERAGFAGLRRDAPPGEGIGIAAGVEKGGRVATCAHVRLAGDAPEVVRLVTAYECGAIVNPEAVRRQVEGAAVMGLGGALFEAVHFAAGRITNASLRTYRVPRFCDLPAVDVVLVDRPDLPSAGAGETPIIAIAPALANAIVAAGGPRIRSLPLLADPRLAPRPGRSPR
ncbi:MAG: molybdopterin cofactor-binding domain-containing protein [Solirubrobacteraceae bacterium]